MPCIKKNNVQLKHTVHSKRASLTVHVFPSISMWKLLCFCTGCVFPCFGAFGLCQYSFLHEIVELAAILVLGCWGFSCFLTELVLAEIKP